MVVADPFRSLGKLSLFFFFCAWMAVLVWNVLIKLVFIAFEGTMLWGVQLAGLIVMESIVDCLSSMWHDPSVFVQDMVERD